MNSISRREFIKGVAAGAAGMALANQPVLGAPSVSRHTSPNLLFIHTDQQHFEAISGLGNSYLHTPHMDRLIRRGVTFDMAYAANPLCGPARTAWLTGRPSSISGVHSNRHAVRPDLPDLGQWLGERGYSPFYSGKWHVPGRNSGKSFTSLASEATPLGEHADAVVSRTVQSFFHSYNGADPFFLSVGFLQPHDCYFWMTARPSDIDKLPYGLTEQDLPPLPENFDHIVEEPPTVRGNLDHLRRDSAKWSPLQWRYYIWSYYRMVEMADAELGRVLDALESSRFASDTLIIFMADHGDGLARRKLTQKCWLYDESSRVPLVIVPPGGGSGRMDKSHVVSGLDIPATLCDYAGVEQLPGCAGNSLRPLVEGKSVEWRDFAVAESYTTGRMFRTPEYKFITYKGETPEGLFDMRRDPWEMRNLAGESKYAEVVADLRRELEGWEKIHCAHE